MNNKGLTIIEMLVVIIVLGIVSSIGIPATTTILSNSQKDAVLTQAVNIERAAKNYCRQDNYRSCPNGTELSYEELSPFLTNINTDYDLLVTIDGGLRNFFVYYAKEGEYSFPYTSSGYSVQSTINGVSYLGAVPTSSNRDLVNRPISDQTPSWQPGVFTIGDTFTYGGKTWYVRALGDNTKAPEGDELKPYGQYQEVTIYYRSYNTYLNGDSVVHNGLTYIAMHDGMDGIEPGTDFGWQEQTHHYRPFNTYYTGNVVTHNGVQYQALDDGMSGIEPGTVVGWQELTDEWRFFNVYEVGDEVTHVVDGIEKEYVALHYTQGNEPGQSTAWSEIVDLGDYGTWNEYQTYPEGTYIIHNDALFEARNYASSGEEPGTLSAPWNEITDEWRFFNVYGAGDVVFYNGQYYEARWWSQNDLPENGGPWQLYID